MTLGLGVDTGGTFTDAAIVDLDSQMVLAKAKASTTYQDLSIGIVEAVEAAIEKGNIDPAEIKLVGLSTTLATNSILQGRGGDVGLIGIGWTPQPEWAFDVKRTAFVRGGYDSMGKRIEPLDEAGLEAAIDEVCKEVDAVVISGMFSVANPIQEASAKGMVQSRYNLPVVMGHDMTAELGIYERTVTAVLNAKLLPIINDFLEAMERSLLSRGIDASIYVFKGDGGLMSLPVAKERPVDTVLSGPAASLMGGRAISRLDSCLVVDLGGTSTDIAYLQDGFPRLNMEGSMVGRWRTRVRAIDIWTSGLGGDSNVTMDDKGNLTIGPDRVVPLAIATKGRPELRTRMAAQDTINFYLPIRRESPVLSAKERRVLQFVWDRGDCTLFEAINGIDDVVFVEDQLIALRKRGYIQLTGLTPTDIMHVQGIYEAGDKEAAESALKIFANKYGDDPGRLADMIMDLMITRIGEEIIKKAVVDHGGEIPSSKGFDLLLRSATGSKVLKDLDVQARPIVPIVGVGAPAEVFIKPLETRLGCPVIVPENHDVGNAVGAVLSQVTETATVRIFPKDFKYIVFGPGSSPMEYSNYDSAMAAGKSYAEYFVKERIKRTGAVDIKVKLDVDEHRFCDGYGQEMKFTNWVDLTATATGKPKIKM
ncbi:MAG: hydantoinase/oxoprolinase family protein [Methanomassiliicoccus sp.]|nr:hydantoinase/oxoprolinase family protein [Methanomassiliicoccus sp.]